MFSVKHQDPVVIESSWKSEKSVKVSETQTYPLEVKDEVCQSVERENVEIQTDLQDNKALVFAKYDERAVLNFLNKVGPMVCQELDKAQRSHAFENYETPHVDDEETIVKLHTLFNPAFVEQKLICTSLSWNSTGSLIAASYGQIDHEDWCEHKAGFCAWNINQNVVKSDHPKIVYEHTCLTCLKFHPEQPSILIGGSFLGKILLWNLNLEGNEILVTATEIGNNGHNESVTAIEWVKNERSGGSKYLIVSCGLDGRILVWLPNNKNYLDKINTLKITNGFVLLAENLPRSLGVKSSRLGGEVGVTSMSFNIEDHDMFVIGSEGGGVFLCSLNSNAPASTSGLFSIPLKNPVSLSYNPVGGQIRVVQFSPFVRNVFVVCSSDGELRLYSVLQNNKSVRQLFEGDLFCTSQWSPAKPMMLFGTSASGKLNLYNLMSSSSVVSAECNDAKSAAWTLEANSKDLSVIASATDDGKIQIWHLAEHLRVPANQELAALKELGKIDVEQN